MRRSSLLIRGKGTDVASSKKRTTMAKLNRETRLRTKRAEKEARRAARKRSASDVTEAATAARAQELSPVDDALARPAT